MADSTTPPTPTDPGLNDSNNKSIWQRWARRQDWTDELQRKAVHKALDIPDDDMQIVNASKTQTGASGGAVTAAALAGGIPATVLAAMLGLSAMRGSQPQATTPAAPAADASAHWDAGLYKQNADGTYTLIDLPMLPADAKVKP